jgi:hypothetical protein
VVVVVDAGATRGVGGVKGAAGGAAEVVGAARGWLKLAKQATKEQCRSWRSDRPVWQSDRQLLYG